ncbi:translation elongation factor EF-1, subunit alpha [Reticulomyxa filosa]|uniref:Translation elongation factor EF-1, subunit alpha n=1 Tax=Reticulomyxa filosa TaxID=46433 RepID=X6NVY7_RETFI|nr:translation elongation factor EF-1, subunit alpha [Reticulomyxa filosa]|eukprot:ETO29989.1 translation elongation factor EF-1, subunit alpha [Reticulomyxa filosa]
MFWGDRPKPNCKASIGIESDNDCIISITIKHCHKHRSSASLFPKAVIDQIRPWNLYVVPLSDRVKGMEDLLHKTSKQECFKKNNVRKSGVNKFFLNLKKKKGATKQKRKSSTMNNELEKDQENNMLSTSNSKVIGNSENIPEVLPSLSPLYEGAGNSNTIGSAPSLDLLKESWTIERRLDARTRATVMSIPTTSQMKLKITRKLLKYVYKVSIFECFYYFFKLAGMNNRRSIANAYALLSQSMILQMGTRLKRGDEDYGDDNDDNDNDARNDEKGKNMNGIVDGLQLPFYKWIDDKTKNPFETHRNETASSNESEIAFESSHQLSAILTLLDFRVLDCKNGVRMHCIIFDRNQYKLEYKILHTKRQGLATTDSCKLPNDEESCKQSVDLLLPPSQLMSSLYNYYYLCEHVADTLLPCKAKIVVRASYDYEQNALSCLKENTATSPFFDWHPQQLQQHIFSKFRCASLSAVIHLIDCFLGKIRIHSLFLLNSFYFFIFKMSASSLSSPWPNVVVLGPSQAGKSSLIGQFAYQTGACTETRMKELENEANRLGEKSKAFAFHIDTSAQSRIRRTTLNCQVCVVYNKDRSESYNLIDIPGKKDIEKAQFVVFGFTKSDIQQNVDIFLNMWHAMKVYKRAKDQMIPPLIVAINFMNIENPIKRKLFYFLKKKS